MIWLIILMTICLFFQLLRLGVISPGPPAACAASQTATTHGTAGKTSHKGDNPPKATANCYEPTEDLQ